MNPTWRAQRGFSLIEAVVGLGVMALVITGGLVALGQASLISEKSSKQTQADLLLRGEVEMLRAASWSEVSSLQHKITSYENYASGKPYPHLSAHDAKSLGAMGLSAEVSAARLNSAGETGKTAFRILLRWLDRSGKPHQEARVLVITEGGISADN